MLAAATSRTIAWLSQTVEEAGFASIGMPASSAQAAFSQRPQLGKLKALMCTATPWRGVSRWRPWKFSAFASRTGFSVEQGLGRAEAGAEPGVIFQRADAAVDVDRGVDLGVAGIGDARSLHSARGWQ